VIAYLLLGLGVVECRLPCFGVMSLFARGIPRANSDINKVEFVEFVECGGLKGEIRS
jgi:hypothetical protein